MCPLPFLNLCIPHVEPLKVEEPCTNIQQSNSKYYVFVVMNSKPKGRTREAAPRKGTERDKIDYESEWKAGKNRLFGDLSYLRYYGHKDELIMNGFFLFFGMSVYCEFFYSHLLLTCQIFPGVFCVC
ncbi:hypothetical protein CEXT_219091 [Caerostris extrusa]|uniref:Uncharacterized protein n=1 Tax=Caerostris extrusa TaxID=172846 RepID=A0AAV4X2U1_CAEEX|nr:hypothetical protein CEXT_219091 [Caerostris extrusa]